MNPNFTQWVIRDERGRIFGPMDSERVIFLIGKGVFTGDEKIAGFPGGDWVAISSMPEFYEKLLEAIAGQKILSSIDREKELSKATFEADKKKTTTKDKEEISTKPEEPPRPRVKVL